MLFWKNIYNSWMQQGIDYNQLFRYSMLLLITLLIVTICIICLINITVDEKDTALYASILVAMIYTTITIILVLENLNYQDYLTSNIEKYTYTVTSLSNNKKTIHTKYGTFDNNDPNPMKTIEVPTTDKSKVGKTYYKVTVYRPQNIAKLTDKANTLVEYKYIYSTPADK